MATFFVDSTGVVTTASVDSDSIFIQSAAVPGSTILGLAGNDTINLTEGAAANSSAAGIEVRAGEGNDLIDAHALMLQSAGPNTLIGGAGADTINISGSNIGVVKGNAGADVLRISGGLGVYSAIGMGAGADEVVLEAGTFGSIALGDGHDKFSASTVTFATAATVQGGNGRDTIALTVAGGTTAIVNGGKLQDLITIDGIGADSTIRGNGGADTITVSGDGALYKIAGNAGADLINISGYAADVSISGGDGNDTIIVLSNEEDVTANILGGAGNDSIKIGNVTEDDTYAKSVIFGGAGADTINFSADATVGSGETLGTLSYSSFSESNLESFDSFVLQGAGISGNTTTLNADFIGVDVTATTVTEASAIGLLGNTTFSGNIASNVLTLSGDSSVSSVTAIMGTVDTLTVGTTNGGVLFETKGGDNYLFIQGGAAGTADDALISLGDLSGGALTMAGSAAAVTFSGQA
ncbi:hypothetical protein [Synechococcus sp. MU1617]|uniref:beta strand repeat-containing protein n=1 Tax=Synechococcus sp. MU1617 TaxID=2508346 RepID=UPI001CF89329|nr:hypothetical protein [Synechococcus sp. MU1617]MCB4389384.1 hypothetical protein [Synechococcus sp. MU1617]